MKLFAKGKGQAGAAQQAPTFQPIDRSGLLGLLDQVVNGAQSGVLELREPRGTWTYAFQGGALTHASGGRVRGARQAFDLLWEFQNGEFQFTPGTNPALPGNLYIDKARLLDLLRRSQAALQGPASPYIAPDQQRPIQPVQRPYSPPAPGQIPTWQPPMQPGQAQQPQWPQPGQSQQPQWQQPAPPGPGQQPQWQQPGQGQQPQWQQPGQGQQPQWPQPGQSQQPQWQQPTPPSQAQPQWQQPQPGQGAQPWGNGSYPPPAPAYPAPYPTGPQQPAGYPVQQMMPPAPPAPAAPAAPARIPTPPTFSVPPMPIPKRKEAAPAPVYQPPVAPASAIPPVPEVMKPAAPTPPKDDLQSLRASLVAQAPAMREAPAAPSWGVRAGDATAAPATGKPGKANKAARGQKSSAPAQKKGKSKFRAALDVRLIKFLLWACERKYSADDHWTLKDAFEVSTMELRDQFIGAFSESFKARPKKTIEDDDIDQMAAGRMRGRGRKR